MVPTDNACDIVHVAGGRLPSGEEYTLCGLIESSPGIWLQHAVFPIPTGKPICDECQELDG